MGLASLICTSKSCGIVLSRRDGGVSEQLDWSFVQIQIVLLRQVGILSFGALAGCEKGYPSGQVMIGDNDENNTITQ